LRSGEAHAHRLRGGGALVEEARARDGKTRQLADHGLKVEERLEATLGDLRLVGRVLRVPAGILEDVPLDHRRRDRPVVAHPDVASEDLVPRRERAERPEQLVLAAGRGAESARRRVEPQAARHADRVRDRLAHQRVDAGDAEGREHRLHLRGVRAEVATGEDVERREGVAGGGGGVRRGGRGGAHGGIRIGIDSRTRP